MDLLERYMLSMSIKQNVCDKMMLNPNDVEINVISLDEVDISFKTFLTEEQAKKLQKIATESIDFFTKERGKYYVREL